MSEYLIGFFCSVWLLAGLFIGYRAGREQASYDLDRGLDNFFNEQVKTEPARRIVEQSSYRAARQIAKEMRGEHE